MNARNRVRPARDVRTLPPAHQTKDIVRALRSDGFGRRHVPAVSRSFASWPPRGARSTIRRNALRTTETTHVGRGVGFEFPSGNGMRR